MSDDSLQSNDLTAIWRRHLNEREVITIICNRAKVKSDKGVPAQDRLISEMHMFD